MNRRRAAIAGLLLLSLWPASFDARLALWGLALYATLGEVA